MNCNWDLYRQFLKLHPDGGTPEEIHQFAKLHGATYNTTSAELQLFATKSNLNIMMSGGEIKKSGDKYRY